MVTKRAAAAALRKDAANTSKRNEKLSASA